MGGGLGRQGAGVKTRGPGRLFTAPSFISCFALHGSLRSCPGTIGLHALYSPSITGTSLVAGAAGMGLTFLVPYQVSRRAGRPGCKRFSVRRAACLAKMHWKS